MLPRHRWAWTWAFFAVIASNPAGIEARGQEAGRIPNFPPGIAIPDSSNRNGVWWLSGDSPYGTYIGPDVSFWAFGDTFMGTPQTSQRQLSSVVANTIAIGQVADGKFTPRYFYRGNTANKQAFFPNPDSSHKYWPKASAFLGGKLYVCLSRVYVDPKASPSDPAGTPDTGTIIARVNNPSDIPTAWQIEFLILHVERPDGQARLRLGIEVAISASLDALVVYGFFNDPATNSNKTVVTLIANEALRNTPAGGTISPAQVQYLAAGPGNSDPRWRPGLGIIPGVADDYLDTRIDCVSGFTARYNAILNKWQVVGANSQYAARAAYPPNDVYKPIPYARIFTHPSPFGPFDRDPQASNCYFYTFPELSAPDPSLYCYCARQWQDSGDSRYNTDANLLLTYTYSSRDVNKQVADYSVYQNRYLLIANPYSGPQGGKPSCPDGPKAPDAKGGPDPFASPDVPRPLPFPGR